MRGRTKTSPRFTVMTEDKGIFIKNIYYMLSYAFQELRRNNYENIAGEEFDGIHDLFAEIIARGISFQLKQGLHRRYVEHTEDLPTLRGKLNLTDSIKSMSSGKQKLVCDFDEYSENNIFNQILKSTLLLLIAHPKVKAERKKSLRRLAPFFNSVSEIDLDSVRWNALRFDRNSKTYQMLLYLCFFIVDDILLTTDEGKYKMFTFSDNRMCRLFEKFVLEYFRTHHPEYKPTARQIEWNIIKDETSKGILPILQTDVFLTIGERTLIIDTKYYGKTMQSNFEKKTIHSANQNQIFTYVVNHDQTHSGKTDGMLLYAKTQEEIQPNGQVKLHDGNMLYYRNLDLNQDFDGIKQQLEALITPYKNEE